MIVFQTYEMLHISYRPDGTMFPKPEVYHDKSCPLYMARKGSKDQLESENNNQDNDNDNDDEISDLKTQAEIKRKKFGNIKSDSVCSCGSINIHEKDALLRHDSDKGSETDKLSGEVNKGRNSDEAVDKDSGADNSPIQHDLLIDLGDSELPNKECDRNDEASDSLDVLQSSKKMSSPRSPRSPRGKNVSFSIDEDEIFGRLDKESPCEDVFKGDHSSELPSSESINRPTQSAGSDKGDNDSEDKLKIGNITYLPVRQDSQGQVTLQSVEETQNALSKLSTEAFEQTSKSETNSSGNVLKSENQDIEKKRSSSTSSLGPFSPSPHLSAFVNYATGFFSRTESQKDIKDIQDVMPDSKLEEPKKSFDIPMVAAAPSAAGKRRGKISRHSNTGNKEIEVESAVKMNEKIEDLFSVDYDSK